MIVGVRMLEKQIAKITASHGCTLYGFADIKDLPKGNLANFHRGIFFAKEMPQ